MNIEASSQIPTDALFTGEFDDLILSFYRITNNSELTIPQITPLMETLKRSNIISALMRDPDNETAKYCFKKYIDSNDRLPSDFVCRFLTLITLKFNLTPRSFNFTNQSYVAKIITENVRPPKRLTNMTAQSRIVQLINDVKNVQVHQVKNLTIPQTVRPQLNNDDFDKIVNAMGDLHQVIIEGYRSNGYDPDPYISTHAPYP